MNVNYYDSVEITHSIHKEQGLSLSNSLYNLGTKLAKSSNMYQGKLYTMVMNDSDTDIEGLSVNNTPQTTPSTWQKIGAVVGSSLKRIASFFDKTIDAKHALATELGKAFQDQNADEIKKYKHIIFNKDDLSAQKNIKKEGVAPGVETAFCLCYFAILIGSIVSLACSGKLFN